MILAVDAGNTNIVAGGFENNQLVFTERISTNQNKMAREYFIDFRNILEFNNIESGDINGAVISSVVPSVTGTIEKALSEIVTGKIFIVKSDSFTGLNILTDNPSQVGTDRITDAAAVIEEYSLPAVIIDMGTATTISVIDAERNFIGGIIMAGVRISLDALSGRTSQLPGVSFEPPENIIGKNTADCMKSGIVYGTASCIDGLISRIEKSLNQKITAIATGGMSGLIVPYCEHDIIRDENLLLKGLMYIYNKNYCK